MQASDLMQADVGAPIEIPLGTTIGAGLFIYGHIVALDWPIGMVQIVLDNGESFVLPGDKEVLVAAEWLRMRALTEPDLDRRHIYLNELAQPLD